MFTGVCLSIKSFKKLKGNKFEYLQGMGACLLISLVIAVSFTVFVLPYVLIDQSFMEAIRTEELHGIYISACGVAIIPFIEVASS